MKFGKSTVELLNRAVKLIDWHPWFAWYPVRCYTSGHIHWLETIERKADQFDGENIRKAYVTGWKYREISK